MNKETYGLFVSVWKYIYIYIYIIILLKNKNKSNYFLWTYSSWNYLKINF